MVHAPCGGEAGGPRALWHWRTHPPAGRERLGAGAANGRRGEEMEKSLLRSNAAEGSCNL